MRKIIVLFLILLIGNGIPFAEAKPKDRAKVTIKIATLAPRGSSVMNVLEKMRDKIREETNNEVYFKIYPGAIQGDEKDVLTKMRLGQLHGGAFTSNGMGRIVTEVRVTDIPFLFKNYEEVTYVRSKLQDKMEKLFDEKGYVVIGWSDIGFVHTFSKEPITSIEALRKMKVWVWGDDVLSMTIWENLDVTPVSLSITDVLTSLSTRLIDTAPCTPFGAVAFRWYTKFDYITEIPSTDPSSALLVTKKIFNKISPEGREKVLKIAKVYYEEITRANRKANTDSLKVLKDAGIKIVPANEKTIAFANDLQFKAREALIGKLYTRELLNEVLGYLEEYRKMHPESDYIRIQ
ncbi:MAG: TRAP transporter substrate-binding protein DctP [Deltaproteobacteria bacterium]|nr:TRAP transporter substrate-binding protein DctP [Deltaproteobacteria bacterium]